MWRGGKPTVSTASSYRHRGKGDDPGVPPGRWQGHRGGGEDTPTEHESSRGDDKELDEDGEEGEVTSPPHSLPCEALPSLGDTFSGQAGIVVGARQPKWP
jgi:hypothetical protein